jgi:hypothetical protein
MLLQRTVTVVKNHKYLLICLNKIVIYHNFKVNFDLNIQLFPGSIICKSTSISLHFMCVGTAVTAESNVI